jgi:hypothetical protein
MANEPVPFDAGDYSYLPAVFQYSAGVQALAGFTIRRVRLRRPVPVQAGLRLAADFVRANGRPLTALCACELRSPAQMSDEAFVSFNRSYVTMLSDWGLIDGAGANPVARSNVCPAATPPSEPCLHAFSFTVVAQSPGRSFVISGSGEVPEGKRNYRDFIVRPNDMSAEGLGEKARFVIGEMERRMGALGFTWSDATAAQVYTVRDFHDVMAHELAWRCACDVVWHYARPPVAGLDFEMDCRAVTEECVITAG